MWRTGYVQVLLEGVGRIGAFAAFAGAALAEVLGIRAPIRISFAGSLSGVSHFIVFSPRRIRRAVASP